MNKRITFRHMDHSAAMEEHCNLQLAKVEEFLSHEREPIYIDFVLEAQRTHHHHLVELRVKTPNYNVVSNHEGPDMYAVIDRVIDTMYHELHEAKRRRIDDERKSDHYKGA